MNYELKGAEGKTEKKYPECAEIQQDKFCNKFSNIGLFFFFVTITFQTDLIL